MLGYFNKAGATGHVFLIKNGKRKDKGIGYSGICSPGTTIAIVPTVTQIEGLELTALTKDDQTIRISGSVNVVLVPEEAVKQFDFTVDAKTGSYQEAWTQQVHAAVIDRALVPIREKVRMLDIKSAVSAHHELGQAVTDALTGASEELTRKGITFESCSIMRSDPLDNEVAGALAAEEREKLLGKSDQARHARQLGAATNTRTLKTYEAATAQELEKERAKLIEEQGKNVLAEAEAAAKATTERLKPYENIEGAKMLGMALIKMAEGGVENLTISPELVAALKSAR